MLTRLNSLLALTCLLTGTVCAAEDPFCGKWKFNPEKSKISGEQMKIDDLGNNKYKFTHGNDSDIVTADGTDQPIHYGYSMSVSKESANDWKVVFKMDGKIVTSLHRLLSDDGSTLTSKGTNTRADGTTSDFQVVDKRVGTGSGFAGTWQSADVKIDSPDEWEIEAYGTHGLTFNTPAEQDILSMNFDGKDYAEKGPRVAPGSTSSGKRINANTLEVTDKIKGKVMDRTKFEISPDGRSLTLTVHDAGQPTAITVVYDKV